MQSCPKVMIKSFITLRRWENYILINIKINMKNRKCPHTALYSEFFLGKFRDFGAALAEHGSKLLSSLALVLYNHLEAIGVSWTLVHSRCFTPVSGAETPQCSQTERTEVTNEQGWKSTPAPKQSYSCSPVLSILTRGSVELVLGEISGNSFVKCMHKLLIVCY